MAGAFGYVATLSGGGFSYLNGISDIEVYQIGGVNMLYTASAVDGGLTGFRLTAPLAPQLQGQLGYSPSRGTLGVGDITLATVNGTAVLIPGGRYDDNLAIHRLGTDGSFVSAQSAWADPGLIGGFDVSISVSLGGQSYLIAGRFGLGGLTSYALTNQFHAQTASQITESVATMTADIAALASVSAYGKTFVFAASATENGVTAFDFGTGGVLSPLTSIGAFTGIGMTAPTEMLTATLSGVPFLVVGSAESDALSVFRITSTGLMMQTDHVVDTLGTRFDGVSAMDMFQVSGRSFLLAGGGDGGITLFELMPNGRLHFMSVVTDTAAMTLRDVSGIASLVTGTSVAVYVTSEKEAGITVLSLDMTGTAPAIIGTTGNDVLTGGAGADLIWGGKGQDSLSGGAGDDLLLDGWGNDQLWGGAGADTFVFDADGMVDEIMDFQLGADRIDLSAWSLIYWYGDLTFTPTASGVTISFEDEVIDVHSMDGTLYEWDFGQGDFLF